MSDLFAIELPEVRATLKVTGVLQLEELSELLDVEGKSYQGQLSQGSGNTQPRENERSVQGRTCHRLATRTNDGAERVRRGLSGWEIAISSRTAPQTRPVTRRGSAAIAVLGGAGFGW
jgi:hypothetical protein